VQFKATAGEFGLRTGEWIDDFAVGSGEVAARVAVVDSEVDKVVVLTAGQAPTEMVATTNPTYTQQRLHQYFKPSFFASFI